LKLHRNGTGCRSPSSSCRGEAVVHRVDVKSGVSWPGKGSFWRPMSTLGEFQDAIELTRMKFEQTGAA